MQNVLKSMVLWEEEGNASTQEMGGGPFPVLGEGELNMSEQTVCRRCGYEGPSDARYCAHCGRALVPPRERFALRMNRILDRLSPLHLGLIGLALSVPISLFAHHLLVIELSIPLSLLPMALVLGGGFAYLGWDWQMQASSRSHLVRMLWVFVGMGVLLAAVWLVDRGLLTLLSDSAHMIVYEIPGVYRESSPGYRHLSIDSNLSYWIVALLYGALTAVGGYLIERVWSARGDRSSASA